MDGIQNFSLNGKKAVLVGGGGYFGPYFTQALIDAGAVVTVIDKSPPTNEYQKAQMSSSLRWIECDLYDEPVTRAVYMDLVLRDQAPDILVNNAFDFSSATGFNHPSGRHENISRKQFMAGLEAGIYWPFLAMQVFGPAMKLRGRGSIINIGSMYAIVAPAPDLYVGTEIFNPPVYPAVKAGVLQLTKVFAAFLSPQVRVNAFSPGAIPNVETKTDNAVTLDNPVLRRLHEKTLLKRMGHPRDLTGALTFLASDASGYITGQNIVIDGGLTVI